MSGTGTAVTAQHFSYIAAHTRGEDAFLQELKSAAREAGIPEIWIAPEQAGFLQILLKAAGARRVVEAGTLAGYSAIQLARALPADGRVDTIEAEPRHAEFAERWIAKSEVAARIRVHRGKAGEKFREFPGGSADAVFRDADKRNNPLYLEEARRIVRKGGLILVDNAFAFGELLAENPKDPETGAIRAFNDQVARTPGLHAVIVPLGDGVWVGVKE